MARLLELALLWQWILRQAEAETLSKTSADTVLDRMKYWKDPDTVQEPVAPSGDRYLIFDYDSGGLNNLRIGWEMAALAAVESNRTLVYPGFEHVYLLGAEPSGLSYYVNMDRLRSGLSAISVKDFIRREEKQYSFPSELTDWSKADGDAHELDLPRSAWQAFRRDHMKSAGGDQTTCDINTYRSSDKLIYSSPSGGGRLFSCGNWPNVGEPRFTDGHRGPWNAPDSAFLLLRNHFVWHPDAFDIAANVVEHLGIFNYVSMHARYGDFQFQKHQAPQETLLSKGWLASPSLLQVGSRALEGRTQSLISSSAARARGRKALNVVRGWLGDDMSRPIYIATDDRSDQYLEPFRAANLKVVRWKELMEDAKEGRGPLVNVLKKYSPARIDNLCGVVEQLICTYGRVFIGSEKSTFTGYIERMRLYAQAPTHATFIKYNGMDASDKGLRLFHDDAINQQVESKVAAQIALWEKSDLASKLDRDDVGALPRDAA